MTRQAFRLWGLLLVAFVVIGLAACGSPAATPADDPGPQPQPTPTAAPAAAPTATSVETIEAQAEVEPAPHEEATVAPAEEMAAAEPLVFAIDAERSEARFYIDEVLRGAPFTVVGVTKLVNGSITANPADLSQASISTIQIDASTLTTDSGMRNNAIRRFVLQSANQAYQYITFEPTAIEGLPSRAEPGDQFSFTITGDLKIRDISQPVTFAVNAIADSASQISGLATTTVTRAAYQLTIPSVPSVADVSDEVKLELEFVAVAP